MNLSTIFLEAQGTKMILHPGLSRSFILLLFFLLIFSRASAQQEEVLQELIQTIENTAEYDAGKIQRINELKVELKAQPMGEFRQRFDLTRALFYEYRIFKQDSAFKYALISKELAEKLGGEQLLAETTLDLANVCVSAGMFREALGYLDTVVLEGLPETTRFTYFGLLGRCYTDMAEYSSISYFSRRYEEIAEDYHEKALSLALPGTWDYIMLHGYLEYKNANLEEALNDLLPLLEKNQDIRAQAVINSVLGDIYAQMDNKEKTIFHLSRASIADIKSSAKENLAMIRLAEFLFKEGEIKLASEFIKKANQDAESYGAQQRKIRVGAILPLIEEQIIEQVETQRQRLYRQNIMLSVLLVFVLVLAIVTYLQVRRLKKARRALVEAHHDLQVKNEQVIHVNEEINLKNIELNSVNNKLLEANKIKEEYIGFFFTQDADIFEKFKEFKTRIEENLKKENLDGIKYLANSYDLKREKKKLLRNFDEAFIKLFPNFTEEFNSLLKDEEKIRMKEGQILNKELRIFALMRLGINHNEIIAQILGYSVNSIYAYKTKIRKKSMFDKKDFDRMLLENTRLKL
ncbi:DUF6377 domain-containing protein [Zunongwangia sp. F363]|uniref:DUF6377 domain-containing protein n=1 Tax=Autumnicola tepida TaxID=3075595 RepID=A0ABU3CAU2_9FLAO|nr:DUF6377 domain-containing protein [Zunongwangia sp. F363]MDT0643462.1 DUF6377 domain-containing protein [Zunongwangia sp. F363]